MMSIRIISSGSIEGRPISLYKGRRCERRLDRSTKRSIERSK
jgi:hypothetical protein